MDIKSITFMGVIIMSMNYFKNIVPNPTLMGLILSALSMVNTIVPMENPYRISTPTNYITHETDATGSLALVRHYLSNRKDASNAIAETLTQQNETFAHIHKTIASLKPTATLTPQCYIAFEEKNEKSSGYLTRIIRTTNADANGLIESEKINLTATEKGTFTIKLPKNAQPKGNAKEITYTFNEPIQNLIPHKPGYYFIVKGNGTPDKKTCLHLLKTISKLNQYVRSGSYRKTDIPETIHYPSESSENKTNNLITFTQNLYNQAKTLRILHTYDSASAQDTQLANLTKKLPRDLIATNETLNLLQKITIQCKSVYELLKDAQKHAQSISSTLFENAQTLLSQWASRCNTDNGINLCTEQIIAHCDNWLPATKDHARIENKAHTDNKKNDSTPDNRYANGQFSREPIRYKPDYWLNQCPNDTKKLIGQLYHTPHIIPVIHNLYINSPLMIDNFALKYGVKTAHNNDGLSNDGFSYALKGKIFILLPGKGGWHNASDSKTNEPFCIEKIFTCTINNKLNHDAYEVFHRGHECSNEIIKNIINQCYAETSTINENWFRENDATMLAQHLKPIVSQQTETETANGCAINKYHAEQCNHDYGSYYEDCFGNIVSEVTDSSITIWMPPMQQRKWAMEIVLEKPNNLNLL